MYAKTVWWVNAEYCRQLKKVTKMYTELKTNYFGHQQIRMVTHSFHERLTCLQTFASFSSSSDYVQAWRKLGMENHHLNNKSCFFWNVLVAVLRVTNQPLLSLPEGNGLLFLIWLAFFTVLLLLKLAGNFTSFVQATGNEPVADYLCKDGAVAIFGSNHSGKKYFL